MTVIDGYLVHEKNAENIGFARRIKRYARTRSKFLEFAYMRVDRLFNVYKYKFDKKAQDYRINMLKEDIPQENMDDLNHSVKLIKQFNDYLRERNISLLVTLIPSSLQIKDELFDRLMGIYDIRDVGQFNKCKINALLKEELQKLNIKVIDLYSSFKAASEQEELFFRYDRHMNENAHELTARLLYKEIMKMTERK